MSLGALLVQRGIATSRHLEDALACQVIYGDDLVTNLLEVTHLNENLVLAALSEWHGLPTAAAGPLVVDAAAKQKVPAALVREWEIVPLTWAKGVLTLGVASPLARKAEEELEKELGCSVAQRVTLLVRVREALRTHFRVGTDPRVDRLLVRLASEREPASGRKATSSEHPTLNFRSPRPAPPSSPPSDLPPRISVPPPSRQLGPVLEALERAQHRDHVLARVLEYVAAKVSYCALFVVQGNHAVRVGRDGKIASGAMAMSLSLTGPSFLASSRARARVMILAQRRESGDNEILRALERMRVQECAVVPVVVRTRVVGLLYIDGDERGLIVRVLGELESLCEAAGRAFERIIVARKQGRDDEQPSDPAGAPSLLPDRIAQLQDALLGDARDPIPGGDMPALPPPPVSQPPDMTGVLPPPSKAPSFHNSGSRVARDVHAPTVERVPPPAGSSSRVLEAHTPPPAQTGTTSHLPSIIVNLDDDFTALIERVLAPRGDEQAEAELLRQGHAAMPAIMRQFPGPLRIEDPFETTQVPKASECGPLLRLIAGQRKAALPFVLLVIESERNELVVWALLLLTELPYVEAIIAAVAKLFVRDKRVIKAARLACIALSRIAPQDVVDAIAAHLFEDEARETAIAVLGELGQAAAVPVLIQLLDGEGSVLARRSLMDITRHDLGADVKRWSAWWENNGKRHRVEWLIDALSSDDPVLRRLAGSDLYAITRQRFGYDADLSQRERERSQDRFREWWSSEGRNKIKSRLL